MRSRDLAVGCVALGLALGVGGGALRMPMGSLGQPGAGFLPFWVAAALGAMAAGLIVAALRAGEAPAEAAESVDRRRALGMLGGLVLYALLLEGVGFLLSTFVLLAGLTRMLQPSGWRGPLVFGALATGGAWAVFGRWLGVPLPAGSLLP